MTAPRSELILAFRAAFSSGDFASALRITETLADRHPERPEVWRMRAEALTGPGRLSEAIEAYLRAIALAPADARLRVRLARTLARCGRHDAALEAYQAGFSIDPGSLSALHGVVGYRELSPDDPALQTVRAIANGASTPPGSRAFACFLLGRIHSVAGRDEEAFPLYATANRLTRDTLRATPPDRAPVEFRDWWLPRVERGPESLPALLSRRGTDARLEPRTDCPAVLIAGLPRSGKSLVEHLLCAHPALAVGDELGVLYGLIESLDGPPEARIEHLRRAASERPGQGYVEALAASRRPAADRIIDTAPPNLWNLGYLAALHPDAPVILCRRNPLDLGAAIFFRKFRVGHAWSYDQTELGRMLALADRAIEVWARVLPNPIQVVDHEAMVADPIGTRDALLRGLGLDPARCSPAVRETAQTAARRPVHVSHNAVGYGPIVADGVGFGARFEHHFAPMLAAFAQTRAQTAR